MNETVREPPDGIALQLKIVLQGTDPPIWRRVLVPGDTTLDRLHLVLQGAMGWENRHLHVFEIAGRHYGPPDDELEEEEQDLDEASVRMDSLLAEGDRFSDEYDFGDSWIHDLDVEHVSVVAIPVGHAACLDGAMACPPEDSGGPRRFSDFVEAIADPLNDDHSAVIEWFGGRFDAAAFDVGDANVRIQGFR